MSETAKKSTALALPEKGPLTRAIVAGTEFGADSVLRIRDACRKISTFIRNKVETVIREGEEAEQADRESKSPIQRLRNFVNIKAYHAVKFSRTTARNLRLVNKVNIHTTPSLLDEHDADLLLKNDIVDDLESRIGIATPLIEEIERIGRACFDRNIPPERLIAFLESEDVLTMLVDEVLEESLYRGSNLKAVIGSVMDSLIHRLKSFAHKKSREKVDEQTDNGLRKKVAYFKAHYDPRDKKHTIAAFIRELGTHYDEYDVFTWIKKNKALFIEIMRGRATEKYDEDNSPPAETRHVASIVNEVYEVRGQLEPMKFIESGLIRFFSEYKSSDIEGSPAFLRRIAGIEDHSHETICLINIDAMKVFFDEQIQKLQGKNLNLFNLRGKLIDACGKKMASIDNLPALLIFEDKSGTREVVSSGDINVLIEALSKKITDTCQFVSSHVDIRNLLFDPMGIPPEMKKNYQDWFGNSGTLNKTSYRDNLSGIFRHTTLNEEGQITDEEFKKVWARATAIFEDVNGYLGSVSDDLGIPAITVPSVIETNDYAELIKIVNTTRDPRERFAARRKIELAALMYSCMITPRFVYQDEEAELTKKDLQHSRRGLKITAPENHHIFFTNSPDASPLEIDPKHIGGLASAGGEIRRIELINANFNGIDCYLQPTSDEDPLEYMGKKSLFNMLTNLLNEDNKRAKDMTDILRMTFVVNSVDDLGALQKTLETNYISFGRSLKRENRYGRLVDVSSTTTVANGAKSDEYRTLRYVVDIKVPDINDKMYAVPVEIRILLTEDLIKERSTHHPASHRKYEDRRLKLTLQRKLAPEVLFPEVYKLIEADPDDVFQVSGKVVKDRSDYATVA